MGETIPDDAQFECHACDWSGDGDERPTFCPECGSVYVFEADDNPEEYEE